MSKGGRAGGKLSRFQKPTQRSGGDGGSTFILVWEHEKGYRDIPNPEDICGVKRKFMANLGYLA